MHRTGMFVRRGFTLIEMSVVILIIAFIIGGVITGRSLIRNAELRAIVTEYGAYVKATKTFADKYRALPGDMSEAETLWGTDGGCPNTTYLSSPASTTLTCNGNGDGKIGGCNAALACAGGSVGEPWRAWQQLSLADLLEDRLTGRGGSTSSVRAEVGVNVPASGFRPAGWTLVYYLNTTDQAWLKGDQYGHVLLFGGGAGGYDGKYTTEPVLSSKNTYELDQKIDDGLPEDGTIRAWTNYWLPDADTGPTAGAGTSYCYDTTTDRYYTDSEGSAYVCSLIFILGL